MIFGTTTASTNRKIFAAFLSVGAFTLASKAILAAKDLLVAFYYGSGDALDAYLIAILIPSWVAAIMAGAFTSSMIPEYVRTKETLGRVPARKLAQNAMIIGAVLIFLFMILLWAGGSQLLSLVGSGFSENKLALSNRLYLFLLLWLPLQMFGAIWGGLLNSEKRFAAASAVAIISPTVFAILVFAVGTRWGGDGLVAGALAGAAAELAVLGMVTHHAGLPVLPRWHGFDDGTRRLIKQYVPAMASAAIMGSTLVVDQAMASMLGPGSVAQLEYGTKLTFALIALAAVPLGKAMLPYFSDKTAQADWCWAKSALKKWSVAILLVMVPLTLLLFLYSEPITRLLFERGAFTHEDTVIVANVQAYFLWQLPFYLLGIVGVRLMSALQLNHQIAVIAFFNFLLNLVLNYLLMKVMGLPGIALSTTIVYIFSTIAIFFSLMVFFRKCESKVL